MYARTCRSLSALLLVASIGAQSTITTTFASDNGGSVGGAVHFDLTVLNPAGIVLSRIDANCGNPTSTPAALELHTTGVGGTYVGNQVNPAPGTWFLRATAAVTTAGQDNRTVALLNKSVALAPGTYGVTLVHRGCSARYTGTTANPPTQTVFANNDLRLDLGTAQNVPFSSGVFSPRIANVVLYYVAASTDVVDFTADTTAGPGALVVNFTDRSITPSGAISAYAWDFDNDGLVDSTLPNPTAVYPNCGDYAVRLTITAPGGMQNLLWTDLIAVDPLTANFTATPLVGPPPLVVQFTDTSTLAATSWSWDFDGDGVPDSTQQNPSHAFLAGCQEVELTVSNGCRTEQVSKRITAATHSLATTYNANSFLNRTSMIFFDLQVTATEALSVCGIDFTSYTPAGNPMTVDVYLTDVTGIGKETNAAAWRRVAAAIGTTAGSNSPSRLVLDRPILLLPGQSYGVGVHHFGNASNYVNLSAPIANADLTLTPVAAAYIPNGPFSVAPQYVPRQWVGEIHYLKQSQWPQAGVTFFGPGCSGSLGVPTLEPIGASRPLLGTSFDLRAGNLPLNSAFVLLGFSNTTSPVGPLPVDLGVLGMGGCSLRVSLDLSVGIGGAGNSATFSLFVPVSPALAGILLFEQALVPDPLANNFGATMSDAVGVMTGVF